MRTFSWGVIVGVLLAPSLLLIAALAGRLPVAATAEPPGWEVALAQRALARSVGREALAQDNPVTPSSENLRAGMRLYRDNCAGCHGEGGKPSTWGSHAFYPRVPQFDAEPPSLPDWQLFWIVTHGVRYSGMGAWDRLLPADDRWKIVTFLSRLRSLPPDVRADWQAPPR